jgi:hypothetical protein
MHRIRVSLGPYGYWLKSRDEDDAEKVPDSPEKELAAFLTVAKYCVPDRGKISNISMAA